MNDVIPTKQGAGALTIAAFALAALMLFAGLGALPLMQPDEGRNATVAREMYASGSWLVPTLHGNAYLDKPAFFFKSVALCFSAFGVSETAARLPSALAALGVVIATWLFGRRVFGARVAAIAVAVVATSPMFFLFARIVIMDMQLALFVVSAIFCGAIAEEYEGRRRMGWLTAGAAAAGLATCVKGPVGFFLPVLVLGVWHCIERRPRAVLRIFHPLPFVVFWAIALAWFIPLCKARPDFLYYGLVEETVKRATTNSTNREKPWFFFGEIIAGGCFAWFLLYPAGAVAAWRARNRLTRMDRLCLVWTLAVVLFFSISKTKQPGYILTVAIPAGLLIARLFDVAWNTPSLFVSKLIPRTTAVTAGVLLAGGAFLFFAPPEMIGRFFRASALKMQQMGPLLGPVGITLVVLGLLGLAAWRRRSVPVCLFFFAALLPALVLPNLRAIAVYAETRSSRAFAHALPEVPRAADFVCISTLPSALPFYLQREVTFIDADFGELGSNYILYTLRQTNHTRNLVLIDDMERWLAATTNQTFVLFPRKLRPAIEPIAAARGATIHTNLPKYGHVLLPAR